MSIPQNENHHNVAPLLAGGAASHDAEKTHEVTPRRSGPFAQIPSAAVYDQRLSADAFRLLAALTTHADHHGECYPRQDSLAGALGVAQSSISKWLGELVNFGYVTIIGRRRYGAHAWRYVYQIQYQPSPPDDIVSAITSNDDIPLTISSAGDNKNISIKNRELIPSNVPAYPKSIVNPNPPARSAPNRTMGAPAA